MSERKAQLRFREAFRIILVDADEDYRDAVCSELADQGFIVRSMGHGAALLDYFAQGGSGEIVVMDWRLPGLSGAALLAQLRQRGIGLPVIFLTGLTDIAHESEALDSGALDFVSKSRGSAILAKRIRLILASAHPAGRRRPPQDCIRHGNLTLRPQASRALWCGQDVGLTVAEYNIVYLLLRNLGEYVTYRAIYDRVHHAGFMAGHGDDGYRTNVRSSVKRIRNKFRAVDPGFSQLENFAAFGYRWRDDELRPAAGQPQSAERLEG
ncbi:MAG TPA: response regulator transcription factor [Ferrovibrio sp.]|jgi:two-component system response regulator ChvI|uniref:response regulator transcription factor n=1 Tax=Ferrovibrio sp. TaxID=1917215 RepID=UPI002ED2192E